MSRSNQQFLAIGNLMLIAAKLVRSEPISELQILEEKSGRILGRRAFSKGLDKAEENLRCLAIEIRRAIDTLARGEKIKRDNGALTYGKVTNLEMSVTGKGKEREMRKKIEENKKTRARGGKKMSPSRELGEEK